MGGGFSSYLGTSTPDQRNDDDQQEMIMKSDFDSNTIQNHTGRVIRDISRLDSEKSKVCPRLHVANSFHPCICLQRTQCCI